MGLSTGNRVDSEEPGVLAITDQRVLWASKALGSGGVVDFRLDPTRGRPDYGQEVRSRIRESPSGQNAASREAVCLDCRRAAERAVGSDTRRPGVLRSGEAVWRKGRRKAA